MSVTELQREMEERVSVGSPEGMVTIDGNYTVAEREALRNQSTQVIETEGSRDFGNRITVDGVVTAEERTLLMTTPEGRLNLATQALPQLSVNPTREELVTRLILNDRLMEIARTDAALSPEDMPRIFEESRRAAEEAIRNATAPSPAAAPAAATPASLEAPQGENARLYRIQAGPAGLHQNQVDNVQQLLMNAGLDVGAHGGVPDNKWGPKSQAAFTQLCHEAQPPIDPATVDFNNPQDPETMRFVATAQARGQAQTQRRENLLSPQTQRELADGAARESGNLPEASTPRTMAQYTAMSTEDLTRLREQRLVLNDNTGVTADGNFTAAEMRSARDSWTRGIENEARADFGNAITIDGTLSPEERQTLSQTPRGRATLAMYDAPQLPENPSRDQLIERLSLQDRLQEANSNGQTLDAPDVARIIADNRTAVTTALASATPPATGLPESLLPPGMYADASAPAPAVATPAVPAVANDSQQAVAGVRTQLANGTGLEESRVVEAFIEKHSPGDIRATDANGGNLGIGERARFEQLLNSGTINVTELSELRNQMQLAGVRDGQQADNIQVASAPTLSAPGQAAGREV